jgi:serine/threonine-protein kinase
MTQPRLLGGRYELDGIVGRGGMAEVFRARDIRLDRIVAVKTLRDDLARDQTFQARFRREAQSAASLNHPSIVAVYDTGEDMVGPTPVPYIVMEYVDGRTLRDLLRDDRRLLPERALEITDGVLRALDYSHRNGIVHRDIKPGNVMLTRNGEVKVMDFGIARAVSDAQATMTQTAQVIGTAQYLSPEQAQGKRVDARSDLYSTGCLLYELLTGRPPFTGDSPVAIAYQHVRENPVPPSRIDPEIPPWADSIVLRAMAKDPGDRYQSAGEMRNDIQRALQGMPVAAPAHTMGYQGTRRMGQATQLAGPTGAIPPYQYGPEAQPMRPEGPKKWPWVVAALVALVVIAGLVYAFNFVSSGGGNDAVPDVVGQPVATAEATIANAHLVAKVVDQPSSSVASGRVIGTNPPFGSTVAKGSQVTLFVSTGAGAVRVPNVVNENQNDATTQLQALGFNVSVQTAPNSTQPSGQVVHQNPVAGSQLPKGSTVTIFVSGGGTRIPQVVGETQAQATTDLENNGFGVNTVTAAPPGSGFLPGSVWKTSPEPGSVLPPNSTVTIFVVPQPTQSPTPTQSQSPSPNPTSSTPSTSPSTPPGH